MTLRILESGLCTMLVDHGRPRSRRLGVPVGGASDRFSLAVGNALVGNPAEAAALEVCLAGPRVVADRELGCVVYGAPFEISINGETIRAGKTFMLAPGEELHIGGTPAGRCAYLCVQGGFGAPVILDSRSGLDPLVAGAEIPCEAGRVARRFLRVHWSWNEQPTDLRVLPGPQADWFREEEFYHQSYRVTPASDRMGLRLEGAPLTLPAREMVSEPVCPGSVQVTRDGRCIILGVDGQTIGGYPKIAQVIAAEVDKLGQLRPGDAVRILRVGMDEANTRYRQKEAELREWLTRLKVSPSEGW